MKREIFNRLMLCAAVSFLTMLITSCQKDSLTDTEKMVLRGIVLDYFENPVEGAIVSIDGTSGTAVTDASGLYSIPDVVVTDSPTVLTVLSEKHPEKRVPIVPKSSDGYCYCDVILTIIADIQGRVLDAGDSYQDADLTPFEHVEVALGDKKTLTGKDGAFSFESVEIFDRDLQCGVSGYPSVKVAITAKMYDPETGIINVPDIVMAKTHIFPGMTMEQILNADEWYFNEYRGGNKNDNSITDRGVAYLSVFDFHGPWQESADGTIIKKPDDGSKPVNLNDFYSYFIGRKTITEDNCILTLNMKCTGEKSDGMVNLNYGVQVMDLDSENPTIDYIGQRNRIYNEVNNYTDEIFDLSAYQGHKIAIGIGVYCADAGEHAWKQLIIRKMTFSVAPATGAGYAAELGSGELKGLEGWHISSEIVRSTMLNPVKMSTGIPPAGLQYGQPTGYNALRKTGHLATNWAVQYVNAAPELIVNDGFLMKCRDVTPVNTVVPEMYIYSKYSITPGSNKMTFKIGAVFSKYKAPVYLKLTVIRKDGSHEYVPVSAGESTCAVTQAKDGCWQVAGKGDLVYDLSKFDGQDVVVTFGIFQGEFDASKKEQHRFALAGITLN